MTFATGWLPDENGGGDRRFVVIKWREDRLLFCEYPNEKAVEAEKLLGPEPITEAEAERVKTLLVV